MDDDRKQWWFTWWKQRYPLFHQTSSRARGFIGDSIVSTPCTLVFGDTHVIEHKSIMFLLEVQTAIATLELEGGAKRSMTDWWGGSKLRGGAM